MRLRLPLVRLEVAVPRWCVVVAVLWLVTFFSFVIHTLAIGGDAINGKTESDSYYLWSAHRSENGTSEFIQVSKARFVANYIHGVATIILALPAFMAVWRIVGLARRQMRSKPDVREPKM